MKPELRCRHTGYGPHRFRAPGGFLARGTLCVCGCLEMPADMHVTAALVDLLVVGADDLPISPQCTDFLAAAT